MDVVDIIVNLAMNGMIVIVDVIMNVAGNVMIVVVIGPVRGADLAHEDVLEGRRVRAADVAVPLVHAKPKVGEEARQVVGAVDGSLLGQVVAEVLDRVCRQHGLQHRAD